MKKYNSILESFTTELAKISLKNLLKYIPRDAFDGLFVNVSKSGANKVAYVNFKKSSTFPKGLIIFVDHIHDQAEAKAKAYEIILRRFEDTENYGTFDALVQSGKI